MVPFNELKTFQMAVRKSVFVAIAIAMVALVPSAHAQTGFVTGPLSWTPVLRLREAGVDSNVFNAATDPKQDVTGGLGGAVDGKLDLPALQLTMQGASEYSYFEQYKSQAGVNSTVAARATLPLTYFQPSVYGSLLHTKERSTNEFDVRAPHNDHTLGAGATMNIGQRFAVIADAYRAYVEYSQGSEFAGEDLATRLNRRSSNASSGVRVTLTPFTSVTVDGGFGLDEFDARPQNNTRNLRGNVGISFSPDAVISGQAKIGYHKMYPEFAQAGPGGAQEFSGLTSSVDLAYLLWGGATRLGALFSRDTAYSISATSSYYLTTTGGLDITQTLPGPFLLNVHGNRQQLRYPTTALASGHTDAANVFGGGLQILVSANARIALNYDYANRRSVDAAFNYDRRHIYTTVTYGF